MSGRLSAETRTNLRAAVGCAVVLAYAAFVAWVYATQPRTLQDVRTGAELAAGAYRVDAARFQAALALFREGKYAAARDEWARADPARRDAPTQFYVAYAFYREGWGRLHNDDTLFRHGLEAVERAIALSPHAALVVDDPDLRMHGAAELKAELQKGLVATWDDLNPMRALEPRK